MFPAPYQTVGYIPAGTQIVRPGGRPAAPVRDREPLLVPVRHGQRHAGRRPAHGRGDDRPDVHDGDGHVHRRCPHDLEQTTEVQLVAEIYNKAEPPVRAESGSRTRPSSTRRSTTSTWWAGRSRSAIFVTSSASAHWFSRRPRTPTRPTSSMGDDAFPTLNCPTQLSGQPYQEVLTNFPLASQVLTGLFLNSP